MKMESIGFRLPKPEAVDVAVDSSEVEEVVIKVETNPDGEADQDLSRSHHQKRVVGVDTKNMPGRTVRHPRENATSVEWSDTSVESADRQTKSQRKKTRREVDPSL